MIDTRQTRPAALQPLVTIALVTVAMLGTGLPLLAQGHEHHHGQPSAASATASEAVGAMNIPDTALLDQDGREVHFYTDLVKDRVVAINFIFTTCTTICPPMGANFGKLQKMMGDRAGRDFQMISVSVDPAVDTPPRLKAWAAKFGRRNGWTLVTGSKPEVDKLLKALKVFTPDKNDHSPIVLVGDERRGEWTRAYGLAPAAKLAEAIDRLLEAADSGEEGS
jgi:protein SCO1/2